MQKSAKNLLFYTVITMTLLGVLQAKEIAKIAEASGIDYCLDTQTFIVVNDEGLYYEIDKKGTTHQKVNLGKYDLEGVVCTPKELIFVVENRGLLVVDTKSHQTKEIEISQRYHNRTIKLFDKKDGVEGIAKMGKRIYLAKQSKKRKGSYIAVVEIDDFKGKIVDIIEHGLVDTAGLTYYEGLLYMVSDKEDIIVAYDIDKEKEVKKMSLKKGAWEGITFDTKGDLYLADDEGRVVKYKHKKLKFKER